MDSRSRQISWLKKKFGFCRANGSPKLIRVSFTHWAEVRARKHRQYQTFITQQYNLSQYGGRRWCLLWLGEWEEIKRIEATEATEHEDHESWLLLPAANVCPLLCADQFLEPLIPCRLVPLLVQAPWHHQCPRIHVLQHLEHKVVVKMRLPLHVVVIFHRLHLLFHLHVLDIAIAHWWWQWRLHHWDHWTQMQAPFCCLGLAVSES